MKPKIDPGILRNPPILRPADYTCKGNKKQRSCWYRWYFFKGDSRHEVALIAAICVRHNKNILN